MPYLGGPDIIEDQQRLAGLEPFDRFFSLLVGWARLYVDGKTLDQLGSDGVERALAAGVEDDGVEVLLRLPGELQRQGGFPRTGLAVQQKYRRLGGESVAQKIEIGDAADEVLRAVVGQVDGRFQSGEALRGFAALEPGDGVVDPLLVTGGCIDVVLGVEQRREAVLVKHDQADADARLLDFLLQSGGPLLLRPSRPGCIRRPDEQQKIGTFEAFADFGDEVCAGLNFYFAEPGSEACAEEAAASFSTKAWSRVLWERKTFIASSAGRVAACAMTGEA